MPGTSKEIAGLIAARIIAGEWAKGGKLPPDRVLAEEYGVNKNTILRAMEDLMRRGMVEGGRGTPRTVI